MKTLILMF